jgi:hypothetical protein
LRFARARCASASPAPRATSAGSSCGGRTAVGLGTFKSVIPCAGGCTDNGTRLKVKLTQPVHCPGESRRGHKEDVVFYGKVAFVLRQRLGVLKPGREWISAKLKCPLGGTPVPIR